MADDIELRRELQARDRLVEEYERRWGPPPMMMLGTGPDAWEAIRKAVRTNKPITFDLPKGAMA